jgi:hypothetical protein
MKPEFAEPGSPEWIEWVRRMSAMEGARADISIVRHLLAEIDRLDRELKLVTYDRDIMKGLLPLERL